MPHVCTVHTVLVLEFYSLRLSYIRMTVICMLHTHAHTQARPHNVMHSAIVVYLICTSSFARSATSPSFAYMSNPAPDNSLCRAAAPRLRPLQLLLHDCINLPQLLATPVNLHPLRLLPAACVCFSCCSAIASARSPSCSISCTMFSNIFHRVRVEVRRSHASLV